MSATEIPEGTVTVLFTDLVESTRLNQTMGDDGAREVGRRIETTARDIVAANRGVLIKEMGDGLMAAFASARRAVAAAREIQTAMRRLHRDGLDRSVEMRIGLHTGEVIGEDGDIHGETVIIAKRIEGLAPAGGVLASETVHGVLGTARDELVEQGATELKGIDAEWRLYLVPVPDDDLAPGGLADNDPTPYVGRMGEREQLRTMLEAAVAGRGGICLIGGPAGLGKSRLAREAADLARGMGMNVLVGHCLDMAAPPPYQPAVDHLEQAARTASPEGFRAALGVNAPEVAKLLPSLRQRYDDIPPSPDLTPEQERRYMLHGVGEFIERAARNQPLVLVYEDLQWADESTLLLLRHLGSRVMDMPLLAIGTYRDDELDRGRPLADALGGLVRDAGAVDLHPRLLGVDEVAAVLAARAGQDAPPDLVELFFAETQGNPYFVEELFRHLRDDGRLFDDEGRWRSGFAVGETEVPQGVRLVIGRRLDRLDPVHRRLLAAAAVIGRTFSFAQLAAAAAADDDDLFDALEAAERANLVAEVTDEGPIGADARHLFVHEQIRQTLLGELSLARRQRIHLRIADALEAAGSSPVELAHHLHAAGPAAPADRTVTALIAAARANLDALAFEDGLRHLDNALARVDDDRRSAVRMLQVEALRGAGQVDRALAVLDDELGSARSRDEEVGLRLRRVRLLNEQYRAAEGLADIEALVAAAAEAHDPELDIAVQLARGRAHYILSLDEPRHAEQSRDAYEAAYEAARARGDRASMARALLPTTWFTDYWADYGPTAAANVAEAQRLAEELGDEDLELDARAASMHRGGVGFNAAESEALLARLEARRDPVKLNAHCFWLMWQYSALGRFADAVATCDRGIELAALIGSAPVQYGGIKAIALSEMGRFDEVDAAIAQEVTDDAHPFGQAMASLARSVFLTRIGAWGPAASSLADTLDRATALSRVWMQYWAGSLLAAVVAECRHTAHGPVPDLDTIPTFGTWDGGMTGAWVALAEGRPEAVVAEVDTLTAEGTEGPIADTLRGLDLVARAHLELADHDAALATATRAVAMADEMGAAATSWRVRRVLALALHGSGRADEAAAEAARAEQEFSTLAARIADPELRAWFRAQTLAPPG